MVGEALDILWLYWNEAAASANVYRYIWRLFRSRVMVRAARHADGRPDLRAAVFSTNEVPQPHHGPWPWPLRRPDRAHRPLQRHHHLPNDQMDLAVLGYLCGMPDHQIAHTLGITPALTHAVDHHARATIETLISSPTSE
ncbi:hypothetical protein [Streptomyces sp. NPDC049915]|uniref:hypothetical protein n=1 Tax=Streptomyces sp. NPDC049915 TaxID=3155510 RepID=UPI00341FA82B